MAQMINQRTIEGAMDVASDGSGSNRRIDTWFKRQTREQQKERWMMKVMDQGAMEGAMDGASDGQAIDQRAI